MRRISRIVLIVVALLCCKISTAAEGHVLSPAARDANGFVTHDVQSEFQSGRTQIRILLPDNIPSGDQFPVVYVLPVEAGRESRYGDGLLEVLKHNLHNKHRAIFVAPTFSHLPWYADHPNDLTIRQESHFVNVVVPSIEANYPAKQNRDSRLLLGFSKSGWGAWTLLLRHPTLFGRAAAWDAPLMMEQLGEFGTTPTFGTQENFDNYRVTNLVRKNAEKLRDQNRLILTGYSAAFRAQHQRMHELLGALKIPHEFRDGPERKHDWHSGWVPEAVELLFKQQVRRPAEKE